MNLPTSKKEAVMTFITSAPESHPSLPPRSFIRSKSLGPAHTQGEGNEASLFMETHGTEFLSLLCDRRSRALEVAFVHCAWEVTRAGLWVGRVSTGRPGEKRQRQSEQQVQMLRIRVAGDSERGPL